MRPDARFLHQPKHFWANVRSISERTGYTVRGRGETRVPSLRDMQRAMARLHLGTGHLVAGDDTPTDLAETLSEYFQYRADVLNTLVEPWLMNVDEARAIFEVLRERCQPTCPLPMNKQKKEKKKPAYFTCIINMIIEANADGYPCDYDPRQLTSVTRDDAPLRTMARRVDGAFPSPVNPIAVWEVKEYYYT